MYYYGNLMDVFINIYFVRK